MAITVQDDNKDKAVQPDPGQAQPSPMDTPASKQQGSGFTNIQRVIGANQGNGLSQAVGGGVSQVGQQAKQAIGQAKTDFQTGVESSNPYLNNTKDTQNKIQSTVADPVANAAAQATNFDNYRSGGYAGPTSLTNYGDLSQQANQAQQLGSNLGSTGGRIALLQRFAADPTKSYSTGASRLDSALLSQAPQGQLQQAQRDTRGLTGQVDTANNAAIATGTEYQARAKALADYTNQQVQGAENPDLNSLTASAAGATADRDARNTRIQSGTATGEDLNAVGLGDLVGQRSYGLDLSKYIQQSGVDGATRVGVSNSDQIAKLQALARLGGQTDLQKEFTPTDTSAIGAFKNNQFTGKDSALSAYNAKKTDYNTVNDNISKIGNVGASNALSSVNNFISSIGGVYSPDSDAVSRLNVLLSPSLADAYIKGNEDTRKQIREGVLSDDTLNDMGFGGRAGQIRDVITNELGKQQTQYQNDKNSLSKFGGTFGTVSAPAPSTAAQDAATT